MCVFIDLDAKNKLRADSHFDLTTRDTMVLMATVNGGKAKRNTMIPLLAKHLRAIGEDESMYDVFLKTQEDIERIGEGQILELRSTMKKRLCLRNVYEPVHTLDIAKEHREPTGFNPYHFS